MWSQGAVHLMLISLPQQDQPAADPVAVISGGVDVGAGAEESDESVVHSRSRLNALMPILDVRTRF